MRIKNSKFVTSFSNADKYAEFAGVNEICVVGRSNVGKSSFINMLAGNGKLAKTSSTPGRTRLINIFSFNNDEFYLVDLPGYGYAKASKTAKESWDELIGGYFSATKNLKQAFVLVDSRHEPSEKDVQMLNYLYYYALPFTIIASKCDKLSRPQLGRQIQMLATGLKVGKDNIITVDYKGTGKDKVLEKLEKVLELSSD